MPIPKSREQLFESVESSFNKLDEELKRAGSKSSGVRCVDNWSVKDLLAVRVWWTEAVVEWIEAGRIGAELDLPAPGYSWQETPKLNKEIVRRARDQSYEEVVACLRKGYRRVLATIADLDDEELLEAGVFKWAGKWPVARWISINTARQYTTARAYVRDSRRG